MRTLDSIKKIIIHCSDSEFGDLALIDQWHKERGFLGCGYHYIILNGVPTHGKPYNPKLDGVLQEGRMLREIGAHCKNHNHDSIGICLIGKHHFSAVQLYQSLPDLIVTLGHLGITTENVFGHRDFDSDKTCPNFDVKLLRQTIGV
jgi:N-acetyl-anhydromuramyl-L-alanine amidase AmpD